MALLANKSRWKQLFVLLVELLGVSFKLRVHIKLIDNYKGLATQTISTPP